MDDAATDDRAPPRDPVSPAAPIATATATAAPAEVILELPVTPNEMRPSLLAPAPAAPPGVERDGLDGLDAPLLAAADESIDRLRAEALRLLRREGSWRTALRALGILLGVLLTFRLAFDEGLPRLLLALGGGALALALAVLLLHHLNETRRQENLLAALAQITNIAREHPSQMPGLAPHLDALLASLRANASVWPSARSPDDLARALTRALAGNAPPPAP